jgi:hypothetical protein
MWWVKREDIMDLKDAWDKISIVDPDATFQAVPDPDPYPYPTL